MLQRLGILVMVTMIAFAGVATCPRGVMACSLAGQAAHDCCSHHAALRADDCCCVGGQQLTSQMIGAAPQRDAVLVQLPVAALSGVTPTVATVGKLSISWGSLYPGLAPPDTPVTRHSSLLL